MRTNAADAHAMAVISLALVCFGMKAQVALADDGGFCPTEPVMVPFRFSHFIPKQTRAAIFRLTRCPQDAALGGGGSGCDVRGDWGAAAAGCRPELPLAPYPYP